MVHLPAAAEAPALAALDSEAARTPALSQPNRIIDMRAGQRIAIRAVPVTTSGTALDLSTLAAGE